MNELRLNDNDYAHHTPLNTGSLPSSRGFLRLPSSCAAAARFSCASLSSPRMEVRGVGGSIGFGGGRKVCRYTQNFR